jgi:hypothetical protein
MFGKRIIPVLIVLAAAAFWGCEGDQGPEGPVGPQGPQGEPGSTDPSIVASIEVSEDNKAFNMGKFVMSIYNIPSIPHIRVNEKYIVPGDGIIFDSGNLEYSEYLSLDRDDSAFLDITYTKLDGSPGVASSDIPLPTQFAVINPAITISAIEDVTAEWSMSQGADAYWVYYRFGFDFFDTAGVRQKIETWVDIVMAPDDTTLVVPATTIFPNQDEIDIIAGFTGTIDIRAVTGPWLPGEANNFVGDAYGVFVGTTENQHIDVHLIVPPGINKIAASGEKHNSQTDCGELFSRRLMELIRERYR